MKTIHQGQMHRISERQCWYNDLDNDMKLSSKMARVKPCHTSSDSVGQSYYTSAMTPALADTGLQFRSVNLSNTQENLSVSSVQAPPHSSTHKMKPDSVKCPAILRRIVSADKDLIEMLRELFCAMRKSLDKAKPIVRFIVRRIVTTTEGSYRSSIVHQFQTTQSVAHFLHRVLGDHRPTLFDLLLHFTVSFLDEIFVCLRRRTFVES
uniref:Uncharacterized protein n=1 Tax=Romanomermis culicivorax TaxID=13658 RepID=A0A915IA04_ROMCU